MKKVSPTSRILIAIGALAIGWYFFAIVNLANWPRPRPPSASADAKTEKSQPKASGKSSGTAKDKAFSVDLTQFMVLSITAIGGTLATFVGMVLGMSQAAGQSNTRNASGAPATSLTLPQMLSAWAYVISLVAALCIWVHQKDLCDDAISHLGQSFLGLVGGALTVMLNVGPANPPPASGGAPP